jgi:hypothetical protein
MATIQMNSNSGVTGNLTLPAPSGSIVAVVNGVGSVNGADVPLALRSGWTTYPTEPWPAVRVAHLSAPPGNWPTSGSITFPDGTTAAISGPIGTLGAITGGTLYTNGTYTNVPLTGGSGGSSALATIVVAGGAVTSVTITSGGQRYLSSDTGLSAAASTIGGTGSGFSVPVSTLSRSDAVIPIAFVNQYKGYGWSPTPYLSGLDQ